MHFNYLNINNNHHQNDNNLHSVEYISFVLRKRYTTITITITIIIIIHFDPATKM